MSQTSRPNPAPLRGAAPPAAPSSSSSSSSSTAPADKAPTEPPADPKPPTEGTAAVAKTSAAGDTRACGDPLTVAPSSLFQLATWAVTPPASAEEFTERRAEVRGILLELVNRVAPE